MMAKNTNKKKNQGSAPEEWKKKKPVNANSKAAISSQSKRAKAKSKGKDGKPAKPSIWRRMINYFKSVKAEMQRVVWPTKEELLSASLIVIGALIFFGILVGVVDNLIIIPLDHLASLHDVVNGVSSAATDAATDVADAAA